MYTPYAAGPGCRASRRQYWLGMRQLPLWRAWSQLRRRRTSGRHRVAVIFLALGSSGRSDAPRSRIGIYSSERFERIENEAAAFTAIDFGVVVVLHEKLQRVRKHTQAATFALIVFHLGESGAIVALGDPVVENAKIVGNRSGGLFALGERGLKFFFLGGILHLDVVANGPDQLFVLPQDGFRLFQAALGFFRSHHDFELAVFGFGDFRFGVRDFVEQGLVGFVGFYGAGLIAIFAGALFPLVDVELKLFSLFLCVELRFLGGGYSSASVGEFQVGLLDELRESFEFGAHRGDVMVDNLEVNGRGIAGCMKGYGSTGD